MAKNRASKARHTLLYPKHVFKPEDLLNFIEMDGFIDEWMSLRLTDDDLSMFQAMIMATPKQNPVIPHTSWFRVLQMRRMPPLRTQTVQVGYVYFEECQVVLLVMARSDGTMTKLSRQHRIRIRRLIEREARVFSKGIVR